MRGPPPYEPDLILEVLERYGVRYVVIGGFAAQIHGSPYDTADVDVTPDRDLGNLEQLCSALRALKAEVRAERDEDRFELILEPEFLARFQSLTLITRHGNLDIILTPDGTRGYDDLRRGATRERITEALQVNVASLADIIRSKEAAGREKDRLHLLALRRLLERGKDAGPSH